MTRRELNLIKKLAESYNSPTTVEARSELKAKAVAVYRKYLTRMSEQERLNFTAMQYMREVDHPIPDAVLKERLRKKFLEEMTR